MPQKREYVCAWLTYIQLTKVCGVHYQSVCILMNVQVALAALEGAIGAENGIPAELEEDDLSSRSITGSTAYHGKVSLYPILHC